MSGDSWRYLALILLLLSTQFFALITQVGTNDIAGNGYLLVTISLAITPIAFIHLAKYPAAKRLNSLLVAIAFAYWLIQVRANVFLSLGLTELLILYVD